MVATIKRGLTSANNPAKHQDAQHSLHSWVVDGLASSGAGARYRQNGEIRGGDWVTSLGWGELGQDA